MKVRLAALDSKVSLALDIWTTRTNLAFLGMSSLCFWLLVFVPGNQIVWSQITHFLFQR